jgi:hypothetical protein
MMIQEAKEITTIEKWYGLINKHRAQKCFVYDQPFTSPKLMEEVTNNIKMPKDAKIGVMFTVEWAAYLERVGFCDITLITDTFDKYMDVYSSKLIGCEYKTFEQIQEQNMKFDVVVGNPPYQSGSNESGNFAIWPLFIKKTKDLLTDNGIMSMVVPQTWAANRAEPTARAQSAATVRKDVFSTGFLSYVNFDVDKYFNVGSTFSYFVWHKKKQDKQTKVQTPNGDYSVDYSSVDWLKVVLDKVAPVIKPKIVLLNNGKETPGFRAGAKNMGSGSFKIVNTSAQYSKNEFLLSSVEHPFQKTKKVIFSDSGYSKPFYDDGCLGIGHHARAIKVSSEKEAIAIIDFLNSDYVADLASTIPDSGSMSALGKLISVGFFDK